LSEAERHVMGSKGLQAFSFNVLAQKVADLMHIKKET
jgi:hypothetical protein